jgi:hypothetical protein
MVLCILYTKSTQEGTDMQKQATFEATYTRYPFAPLVALGIAIAKGLKQITGKSVPADQRGEQELIEAGAGHAA